MVFSLRKSFKNRCRLGPLEVNGHTATVNGVTQYNIRRVVFHGVFCGRVGVGRFLWPNIEKWGIRKVKDGTSLQLGKVFRKMAMEKVLFTWDVSFWKWVGYIFLFVYRRVTDSERFKTLVCLVQRISEVAHNERYVPYTHIYIHRNIGSSWLTCSFDMSVVNLLQIKRHSVVAYHLRGPVQSQQWKLVPITKTLDVHMFSSLVFPVKQKGGRSYCWWLKSCTSWVW